MWSYEKGKAALEFQRPSFHDALTEPMHSMQYFDRNLQPGKTYKYQVSTINFGDLESALSDVATVTVRALEKPPTAGVPVPKKNQ